MSDTVNVHLYGVPLPLDGDDGVDPVLVFGVRKSGSSILNSIVEALAKAVGWRYVDVAGALYRGGVPTSAWVEDPQMQFLLRGRNVLAGFRDCPRGLLAAPRFPHIKKVLLVRDPRDALVSEYFSNARTHEVPDSGGSREEMLQLRQEALSRSLVDFVLERAEAMDWTLRMYAEVARDPNCLLLKYEDSILDKRGMIGNICTHFGWPVDPQLVELILEWADVIPSDERQDQFVRKVLPGDHVEKLSAAVIEELNQRLAVSLDFYGYLKSPSRPN